MPVGYATGLHNPGLRPERELRAAVEQARRDAELNQPRLYLAGECVSKATSSSR